MLKFGREDYDVNYECESGIFDRNEEEIPVFLFMPSDELAPAVVEDYANRLREVRVGLEEDASLALEKYPDIAKEKTEEADRLYKMELSALAQARKMRAYFDRHTPDL